MRNHPAKTALQIPYREALATYSPAPSETNSITDLESHLRKQSISRADADDDALDIPSGNLKARLKRVLARNLANVDDDDTFDDKFDESFKTNNDESNFDCYNQERDGRCDIDSWVSMDSIHENTVFSNNLNNQQIGELQNFLSEFDTDNAREKLDSGFSSERDHHLKRCDTADSLSRLSVMSDDLDELDNISDLEDEDNNNPIRNKVRIESECLVEISTAPFLCPAYVNTMGQSQGQVCSPKITNLTASISKSCGSANVGNDKVVSKFADDDNETDFESSFDTHCLELLPLKAKTSNGGARMKSKYSLLNTITIQDFEASSVSRTRPKTSQIPSKRLLSTVTNIPQRPATISSTQTSKKPPSGQKSEKKPTYKVAFGRTIPEKKKQVPVLIKNLNNVDQSKTIGRMTFDPVLKKWIGNEKALRSFDQKLKRPKLIVPNNLPTSIGGMVFDPVKLCWTGNESNQEESHLFDDIISFETTNDHMIEHLFDKSTRNLIHKQEVDHRLAMGDWFPRFDSRVRDTSKKYLYQIRLIVC